MWPREGTLFPGSAPVIAEDVERGSGDAELTADHLTHNLGMWALPLSWLAENNETTIFAKLYFLCLVLQKQVYFPYVVI